MPALNFKKQFAPLVEQGKKRQTIRSQRKRPFKKGDVIMLYTGMRTKSCKHLLTTVCKSVHEISIHESRGIKVKSVIVDGELIPYTAILKLAHDDGFSTVTQMIDWFKDTHGLPFKGQLIKW